MIEFYFADISPGILGIIFWGLITYFVNQSKKKKNEINNSENTENNISESNDEKNYQFDSILDPQNLFYFDNSTKEKLVEDETILEDTVQDIDIPNEPNVVIDVKTEKTTKVKPSNKKYQNTTFINQLASRKSLKNSFIIKEILDKPLSLRND